MATEKQADLARDKHSEKLRRLGAHAIAVERLETQEGAATYAVVATFERQPDTTPSSLLVKVGQRTVKVPLITRRGPKFQLE